MALTPEEQKEVTRALLTYWSREFEEITDMHKQAVFDAVGDGDAWLDANAASYNSALPNPFRSNATQDQKALLLGVLTVYRISPDFITRILGG